MIKQGPAESTHTFTFPSDETTCPALTTVVKFQLERAGSASERGKQPQQVTLRRTVSRYMSMRAATWAQGVRRGAAFGYLGGALLSSRSPAKEPFIETLAQRRTSSL